MQRMAWPKLYFSFIKMFPIGGDTTSGREEILNLSNGTDIIEHFILMAFPNDLMRSVYSHAHRRRLKQHKFVGYNLVSSRRAIQKNDEIFIRLTIMTHVGWRRNGKCPPENSKITEFTDSILFQHIQHPRTQFVFCFRIRKHIQGTERGCLSFLRLLSTRIYVGD